MANKVRKHLYLPKNLHDKIAKVAREEMRSFNSQCVVYLMQGLEAEYPGWDNGQIRGKSEKGNQ